MKQQVVRTIATLGFLLMLTAGSEYAQSNSIRAVNIPFPFIAGKTALPAGSYRVARLRKLSELVLVIQRREGRGTMMVITRPVSGAVIQEQAKLVFHRYGDQYFLAQIWTPGDKEGRELHVTRRERELARQGVERRVQLVAAGRE